MKKITALALAAVIASSSFPVGIPALADTTDANSCVYEAENAYTGGWARRVADDSASQSAYVERIGGKTNIGTIVFDVWAEEAGNYDLTFRARSKSADSSFWVRINYNGIDPNENGEHDKKITLSKSSSFGDSTYSGAYLNQGWNTVKVYSIEGTGSQIDLDKLTVNTPGKAIDGVIENTSASGGSTRQVYMAKDGSVSTNPTFNVSVPEDGAYALNIWYTAADFRAMDIYIDNTKADTVLCPITGEDYNVETVSPVVELTAGSHTISFKGDNSTAPEIDKIQLVKTESRGTVSTSGTVEFKNSVNEIIYDLATGKADYVKDGSVRVKGFEAAVKVEKYSDTGNGEKINTVVNSSDYTSHTVNKTILDDNFGFGYCYDVVSTANGLPDMHQRFYVYNSLDYIITSVSLESDETISTNFMAPIAASGTDVVNIGEKKDARALFVPFSNDDYVTYDPEYLGGSHTSYWTTCLFDNNTGNAVIAGSLDHDTWKTATSTYGSGDNGSINFFGAFAGVWSE